MPIYLYLTELKKYLEDKLKQPGEQGDTAKQGEFNENENSWSQILLVVIVDKVLKDFENVP